MPLKRLLFLGDICAKPGRYAIKERLKVISDRERISFVIGNGENSAGGFGITPRVAEELFSTGIDCLTSGDHFLDKKEIGQFLDKEPRLLRPLNFPASVPGRGIGIYPLTPPDKGGDDQKIAVINLLGRVFVKPIDCPFQKVSAELEKIQKITPNIIVDFHAEATAEKEAMGWFLTGRVSAVIGTHTHVQTADEQIFEGGTAYITDVGMCGPFDSILGMRKDLSLKRILYSIPVRLEPAKDDIRLQGVIIELDTETGKAVSIERFTERVQSR